MYIRRKVFSRIEDENGEVRLFSTTDYELGYDEEGEKFFSSTETKEDKAYKKGLSTGMKIALASAATTAAAAGTFYGAKKGLIGKAAQEGAEKLSTKTGKLYKGAVDNITELEKKAVEKVKKAAEKVKDAVKRDKKK